MLNWLLSILNSFVVIQGETTVALGHEGMLVSSHVPHAEETGALMVPAL